MLLGSLSPVTTEQERSGERRPLLDQLLQLTRNAFPEVEVLIYEANSSFNAQAFTLGSQPMVTLFGGLADAVFKATGRYPQGTMLGNLVRVAEWSGAIVGLAMVGSFSGVACAGSSFGSTSAVFASSSCFGWGP